MPRQIKFRAWDGETMRQILEIEDGKIFLQNIQSDKGPSQIMQFTGLLDKNGKEIFEGDIVLNVGDLYEHTDKYWEIYFSNGSFWMKTLNQILAKTIKEIPTNSQTENNFVEIIGNIYENPELIK